MNHTPSPEEASFLSTGVVAKALGLKSEAVRAMIEIGSLPEPQWMALGNRVERVYSLEWLLLASDHLNDIRLSGLEYLLKPTERVQFAIRFKNESWTVDEVADKLHGVDALWQLCAKTLEPNETRPSVLHVQKLSAGSPLDLFAWASQNWGGIIGTGGVASLVIYLLKNPAKVTEAIPRAVAGWHEQWARAHHAQIAHLEAKALREDFAAQASPILEAMRAVPSDSAISGDGTMRLELMPNVETLGELGAPSDSPD